MSGALVKRGDGGRFLPGTTGGTGRPKGYKGLARAIQKESDGGQELIDFLFDVLRAKNEAGATLAARQWACEQLLNRGYGRAPQVVEVSTSLDSDAVATAIDVGAMSDEELEIWEKAADIAARHANKRKPIDV